MGLKSLEEHNSEVAVSYELRRMGCPTGVACPECGSELYDTMPGSFVVSIRAHAVPTTPVTCHHCGFHGQRNVLT